MVTGLVLLCVALGIAFGGLVMIAGSAVPLAMMAALVVFLVWKGAEDRTRAV